jgi:hypothetical protein
MLADGTRFFGTPPGDHGVGVLGLLIGNEYLRAGPFIGRAPIEGMLIFRTVYEPFLGHNGHRHGFDARVAWLGSSYWLYALGWTWNGVRRG